MLLHSFLCLALCSLFMAQQCHNNWTMKHIPDIAIYYFPGFALPLVPGMLCATIFPAIIGSAFPGAVYARQYLNFRYPVSVSLEIMRIETLFCLPEWMLFHAIMLIVFTFPISSFLILSTDALYLCHYFTFWLPEIGFWQWKLIESILSLSQFFYISMEEFFEWICFLHTLLIALLSFTIQISDRNTQHVVAVFKGYA